MMKKLLVMAFAAMLLVLVGASAQASLWVPDDHNTNYPNYSIGITPLNTIDGTEILGLFDDGVDNFQNAVNVGHYLALLPDSSSTSVTVAFTWDGTTSAWSASHGTSTIDLGGTNVFQLGFFDGSNWMTDISSVGGNSVYTISFATGDYVTQADANPVPIPPSAIMLFSGLLGFVGIRRVRRDG